MDICTNGLETVDYWALYNPNGQMISNIHTNSGWTNGMVGDWGYHNMPDSGHWNNIQCIEPYNLKSTPKQLFVAGNLAGMLAVVQCLDQS